jgi:hypothetical protein
MSFMIYAHHQASLKLCLTLPIVRGVFNIREISGRDSPSVLQVTGCHYTDVSVIVVNSIRCTFLLEKLIVAH